MASRDTAIRGLAKNLGNKYRVCTIDLERVVYRDFGNGFNVEISGMYTTSIKIKATIYLWHGDKRPDCSIVKTVHDVPREEIANVVESLYAYSNTLTKANNNGGFKR